MPCVNSLSWHWFSFILFYGSTWRLRTSRPVAWLQGFSRLLLEKGWSLLSLYPLAKSPSTALPALEPILLLHLGLCTGLEQICVQLGLGDVFWGRNLLDFF